MLTSQKSKALDTLGRFVDFLKVLKRDKRGVLGVAILIFFSIAALAAPLITPYDPISTTTKIASNLAVPTWFKYLPGGENLTENVEPIKAPGFATEESYKNEWNFTSMPSGQGLTAKYTSDSGSEVSGPGAVAVTFKRESLGEVKALLSREFYYPYQAPPKRFMGKIYVKAQGIKNASDWGVEIRFFIERLGDQKYYIWSAKQGGTYPSQTWISPSISGTAQYPPLIDSYIVDPRGEIFSKPSNYAFGAEVVFDKDTEEATVYIDDLDVKLYGSAFGLLGTDRIGRDIFSQLVYGTRISLMVGLLAAFLSIVLGLVLGLLSGYLGKVADETIMRFTDMLLVLPELPLLLVLIRVLGPSIWNLIILIGFLGWMGFARIVRSQVLSLKERPFVEAAKALGSGKLHIVGKHILPNVMNLVYVTLAMSVPGAIMAEAYLSFLGLYDPYIMTWGRMLDEALAEAGGAQRWWWVLPPGLCIAAISVSFILIGYALDEILNPKLRERR